MSIVYKLWIQPILECGSILYSGAAITYLHHLDNLQSWIEQTCSFVFNPFFLTRLPQLWFWIIGSFVIYWLKRVMGTYKLIVHSFVISISFLIDLIDFIRSIQLSIYILLTLAISGHWINLDTVGWLQLFLLGMIFQLIYSVGRNPWMVSHIERHTAFHM